MTEHTTASSATTMTDDLMNEAVAELFTMHDLLRFAVSQFNAGEIFFGHGTDNPWDEAGVLMAHVLNLSHIAEPSLLSTRLLTREKRQFLTLVQQRLERRIPAAYLTNQAYFADLPFYVDERVLVPRSPIGELIKQQFNRWFPVNAPARILDLCTGSGCIAIACAHYMPEAEVDAIDISEDALEVCYHNVDLLGMDYRVTPILSDGYDAIPGQTYDLIVTNPPYVDADDMADLPDEFRHEPELGLASGDDGLQLTLRILSSAAAHLNDDGVLICEVGNSMVALNERFPQVPFEWIEFEHGGIGVFALTKAQLLTYQHLFRE